MDLDGDGEVVRRYLIGSNGFSILAQETVGTTNETLWLLVDDLGSTRALVDDAGAVVARYAYDSFGNILATSDPLQTRVLYTGLEWDADAKTWHALYRDYESSTTQWLSEDPIQDSSGQFNYRIYVGNAPTMFVDWSGLAAGQSSVGRLA